MQKNIENTRAWQQAKAIEEKNDKWLLAKYEGLTIFEQNVYKAFQKLTLEGLIK